ncbi:riboflavin kinase [Bacteroidota bacterium]
MGSEDHIVITKPACRLGRNERLNQSLERSRSVKSGNKIGREIGFPTANIEIKDKAKLIPKIGIYAIKIDFEGKRYNGMAYIGKRPTFNLNELRIETNIFNFDKNIYNKEIRFSFVQRIRDDAKFNSVDELKNMLIKDKIAAEQILNTIN